MRGAGHHEVAGRLEQLSASTLSRRRWGLRRGSSSLIPPPSMTNPANPWSESPVGPCQAQTVRAITSF